MKKLSLGMLALICVVLLGCAQSDQISTTSPATPLEQPDKTGSDGGRGGMH
jgi:hypothetical protein